MLKNKVNLMKSTRYMPILRVCAVRLSKFNLPFTARPKLSFMHL